MKNIKGPKSALTDFIADNGITINHIKSPKSKEKEENKIQNPKKQKNKKIRFEKPSELSNIPNKIVSLEDEHISNILQDTNNFRHDDKTFELIAQYLSRKRLMNNFYFNLISESCTEKFKIYDCSMIKDNEYKVHKNLKFLELHQCGQLTGETLSNILRDMKSLECLRITGAYLIEDFNLPPGLSILDLSNCSRLSDLIIEKINKLYVKLDELRLSFCYRLTDKAILKTEVKRLYICETNLTESFYSTFNNISKIEFLSLNNCPKINSLPPMDHVIHLDIQGMVNLEKLKISNGIKSLNISYCYNLRSIEFPNLEELNVSHINLNENELMDLCKNKKLKYLDLSWNHHLNDEILIYIIENLNLKILIVWGCFGLTSKSAKLAWALKDKLSIIGNPSETRYLLDC